MMYTANRAAKTLMSIFFLFCSMVIDYTLPTGHQRSGSMRYNCPNKQRSVCLISLITRMKTT